MEYLKEYASNIIIISILTTIFEIITPDGKNKKYITTVLGLVVMLTVMRPITMIANIKGNFFNIPSFEIEESATSYGTNFIADKFEENLAFKISQKVSENLKSKVDCTVKTARNENGEITEIESIEIIPYSETTADYIVREFGIDKNILKGENND